MAKAFISAVGQVVHGHVQEHLRNVPQYAYLPKRDTGLATSQAINHCRKARALLKAQNISIQQARAGNKLMRFAGALQVSIDLAQAFDRAPWDLLKEALSRMSSPEKASGSYNGLDSGNPV